eukprot:TRINITY_DN49802_c0_g1_i1.p1 TRINITY_DN49802_c0_g1~~TRINITY_DN49802_c0_g1_i1.p1  ORF type:complete len:476 (-),score=61.08 TRINITY_DN49802_c0_g1_i1:328-1716(-)
MIVVQNKSKGAIVLRAASSWRFAPAKFFGGLIHTMSNTATWAFLMQSPVEIVRASVTKLSTTITNTAKDELRGDIRTTDESFVNIVDPSFLSTRAMLAKNVDASSTVLLRPGFAIFANFIALFLVLAVIFGIMLLNWNTSFTIESTPQQLVCECDLASDSLSQGSQQTLQARGEFTSSGRLNSPRTEDLISGYSQLVPNSLLPQTAVQLSISFSDMQGLQHDGHVAKILGPSGLISIFCARFSVTNDGQERWLELARTPCSKPLAQIGPFSMAPTSSSIPASSRSLNAATAVAGSSRQSICNALRILGAKCSHLGGLDGVDASVRGPVEFEWCGCLERVANLRWRVLRQSVPILAIVAEVSETPWLSVTLPLDNVEIANVAVGCSSASSVGGILVEVKAGGDVHLVILCILAIFLLVPELIQPGPRFTTGAHTPLQPIDVAQTGVSQSAISVTEQRTKSSSL